MNPLATIERIYDTPLTENSPIRMHYLEDADMREKIATLRDAATDIVEQKRAKQGTSHIRPLNLDSEKAEELRKSIKGDPAWINEYQKIVALSAPDLANTPLEDQLKAIFLPWFNAAVLLRRSDSYDPSTGLDVHTTISHSYVTQLRRSLKLPNTPGLDSASISNVLLTADGTLVTGMRGGHSYSDTIMSVPAGSIEYHTGANPLFETLYAELEEEVGIARADTESVELIGRVYDATLGKNSLYVFRTSTPLTFDQIVDKWESAIDNREHRHLIDSPDEKGYALNALKLFAYDLSKIDKETPAKTTAGNKGSILPPCAATLLLHYAQREGRAWADTAEKSLNGTYVFAK